MCERAFRQSQSRARSRKTDRRGAVQTGNATGLTVSRIGIAQAQSFARRPCNGALCTSSASSSVVPTQSMHVSTRRVI